MTFRPSTEGTPSPRIRPDPNQQSTLSSATSPARPPTVFKVLTAVTIFFVSRTCRPIDSVNQLYTHPHKRYSTLPPNPLKRKDEEATRSLSSNDPSPTPSTLLSPFCPKVMLRVRNPSLLGRSGLEKEGRPVSDGLLHSLHIIPGSGGQSKQNAPSDPDVVAEINDSWAAKKPKVYHGRS